VGEGGQAVPFVKLDCGILHSTLWVERGHRDVFLTALLMASPKEFKTPQRQLAADSIAETGFEVPPGWYGFVAASGPGIVRMALLDQAEGLQALHKLGEPDPESRSSDYEGRRMIRINGGYLILNFMRYRDHDSNAAARMKLLRDRRKTGPKRDGERSERSGERDDSSGAFARTVTEAEAEAEAEAERARSKELQPTAEESEQGSDAPAAAKPKGKAGKRARCPFAEIVALYHEKLPMCPGVEKLTDTRKGYIRQRWIDDLPTLDAWRNYFTDVAASKFLTGKVPGKDGKPPFVADLEWLTRPGNFAKVAEGKYHR
jgi:hypothetical protein